MHKLLDRVPLRIKLVAAVLALVSGALVLIGVSSVISLRSYLVDQIDTRLRITAERVSQANHILSSGELPTTIFVGSQGAGGHWTPSYYDLDYSSASLPPLPQTLEESFARAGREYTTLSQDESRRWRVLIESRADNGTMVVVAEDLSSVDHAVARLIAAELLMGIGVLTLLALIGAALVRASLGPLRAIEHTAQAIARGDLGQRVPEVEADSAQPRTEVGRLGRALNTMLGQIEAAFAAREQSESAARASAEESSRSETRAIRSEERMRQFVADASHELRTPLTTIRGFAELYRQGAVAAPEDVARLVRRIEDEASRMGLLVEDLLLLARLDEERPLVRAPLELRVIATDAVTAARVMAPDRVIELEIAPGTGPLVVLGDEGRLRQVVGNLMANAVTHTPAGTPVWLRLSGTADTATIEVADAGPGMTAEQADRVFERFYRTDSARTRRQGVSAGQGSTGLGLAIVAALVAAHDGTVQLETEPGAGARFRVVLPATAGTDEPEAASINPATDSQPTSRNAPGVAQSDQAGYES